ncbi:hypothetical protein [Candidatus Methylomicrobium oryzae]|uniref:hypothetical protein n=1 Tax=Candidatus Methylomicrobium oryzae TaxID=2802053 RepID=UPI00192303E9|nr:hypothetical protein [Methylomicrobium sp. RS1]MBL1262803.1 hypothetical protein [Methylomicrobium sp. RS1]
MSVFSAVKNLFGIWEVENKPGSSMVAHNAASLDDARLASWVPSPGSADANLLPELSTITSAIGWAEARSPSIANDELSSAAHLMDLLFKLKRDVLDIAGTAAQYTLLLSVTDTL